ncbi:MAG TPA: MauE/DoxX family redox-associated membrane protein [Candidatus Acidoferrales bacterium]|nr:MauE/DoxX family redox-associated membrane protein [Candidatus Acidoferrales bacterium]
MTLKVFQLVCRLVLGGLFLYAGFTKLYPAEHRLLFEIAVSSYQLLPVPVVIIVAQVLPWVEITLGILLIVGWKLRYFATFAALLLGAFIAAMGITYARGIEADCGCFGLGEPISPLTLLRDSGVLAIALFLAVYAWRKESAAVSRAS